jgi:hypothetical protein
MDQIPSIGNKVQMLRKSRDFEVKMFSEGLLFMMTLVE